MSQRSLNSKSFCVQQELFGNSTMELLGVINLQNPICIKRIKQKQLCYAEKSPTDDSMMITSAPEIMYFLGF